MVSDRSRIYNCGAIFLCERLLAKRGELNDPSLDTKENSGSGDERLQTNIMFILYKVISKIIANRLKVTLPDFIALNQSAFVKGKLVIENLLLATQLVKDYHKESISSRRAFQLSLLVSTNHLRELSSPRDSSYYFYLLSLFYLFS